MKFTPITKKIIDIFGGNNSYRIPNFQREFSWKKANFDDFLNDILTASNTKILENENKLYFDDASQCDYFLGTILAVGDADNSNPEYPYIIVDGQQRLTTMTLFFAAIRDIISETLPEYRNNYKESLVGVNTKQGQSTEFARLNNVSLTPILPVEVLNLNNTKAYGAKHEADSQCQEWLLDSFDIVKSMLGKDSLINRIKSSNLKFSSDIIDEKKYIEFIDNIGRQILNSQVIMIYSQNQLNANILFRNFNSRGLPLAQSDLIKNEILSILDDESQSAILSWDFIQSNIYYANTSIDTFIYHYMLSKQYSVSQKSLHKKFCETVKKNHKSYFSFLNELVEASKFYKTIVKPIEDETVFGIEYYYKRDSNPTIKRQLLFLNGIDTTQVRIILLGLFFARSNKKLTNTQFRNVIELVTQNQALHVLANTPGNKLTHIYKKYSNVFQNASKSEYNLNLCDLKKDFKSIFPSLDTITNKDSLIYSKNKSDLAKSVDKKNGLLIKNILEEISLKSQTAGTQTCNDAMHFIYSATLEHIIDECTNGFENVCNLGNLILLEQSKHDNSTDKKEMYSKSEITLTKTFFDEYPIFNSDKCIQNRENILLDQYYSKCHARLNYSTDNDT